MVSRGTTVLSLTLILLAILPCGRADEPTARPVSREAFTQKQLLLRFDADADGSLSTSERASLRRAFGDVDVPMLPNEPHTYQAPPKHISAKLLHKMDNTPVGNPLTDEGAALGRVLFYDTQLSINDTIACASCHRQEKGFADPRQFSRGFVGGYTMRNSMGLANLRYSRVPGGKPGFFWDERAATLEAQALMPIQDEVEMGMKLQELEGKLQRLSYYPSLFAAAFDSAEVTSERISKAIAQFMRSLVSFDSRFDRAAAATAGSDYSQDFKGFTAEENLGKSLFIDGINGVAEIGCAHCHVPPTFGMPKSLNNGLDFYYVDQGLGWRDVPPNDPFTPSNDGKFKAPSLRNIALTGPYMHDGRFETLRQVIEHYSSGVHPHVNLGLELNEEGPAETFAPSGFRLTDPQKAALLAFLKTLTDDKFIADPRFADPFVRLKN